MYIVAEIQDQSEQKTSQLDTFTTDLEAAISTVAEIQQRLSQSMADLAKSEVDLETSKSNIVEIKSGFAHTTEQVNARLTSRRTINTLQDQIRRYKAQHERQQLDDVTQKEIEKSQNVLTHTNSNIATLNARVKQI